MGKKMYLVTHGEREYEADPCHTAKGIGQIMSLLLPEDVSNVVMGTGIRFEEVRHFSGTDIRNLPLKTSPFCGSADSLHEDGKSVVLGNGRFVNISDYIGLDSGFFDAWAFIASHPDRTLFCAGGELMLALARGCQNPPKPEKASIYELDIEARTIKKIS